MVGTALADVERAVVERANLAVVAARIVHAAGGAGGDQELIELLVDLIVGENVRVAGPLRPPSAAEVLRRRRDRIELGPHIIVFAAFARAEGS